LLYEQNGRMAVLSPEGDVFEILAGRYSSGVSNIGVYLNGHAGDTVRVDRIGRASEYVQSPALTVGLAVQPSVIQGLTQKDGFRGRGLLARFLYSMPLSPLGRRKIEPAAVPEAIRQTYSRNILRLLAIPAPADEDCAPKSHRLSLHVEALRRFRAFQAWLEPRLAEFGELGGICDWAGKLHGAVARIAGLLHMAENCEDTAPWEISVSAATVENAISIAEYLIPHAKAAFAEMGADDMQDHAKRIIRWIEDRDIDSFTKRDLHQGVKGTLKRVEDLDLPLNLLEKHGYIGMRQKAERSGAGRRPSPVYDVNPVWERVARRGRRDRSHYFENSENSEKRFRSALGAAESFMDGFEADIQANSIEPVELDADGVE